MRYTKIRFHHVPGQEHEHPHCHGHGQHCHDHAEASAQPEAKTIQLLEYLRHHNEEHAEERAGYCDEIEDAEARGLLDESVSHLNESNIKLAEAIAALKKGN